jgi:hypothetical protein
MSGEGLRSRPGEDRADPLGRITPIEHRLAVIRDNLDRIEAADQAGTMSEEIAMTVGGLLRSFQDRLDNVRPLVPDVKPSEPEAA